MATLASRMFLSRNTKSLPLHLLRARLSTTYLQPTLLHQKDCNFVQFLLGYQPTLGLALNKEGVIPDRRFGGFAEMDRVEASGKKRTFDGEDLITDGTDDDDIDEFEGSGSDFDDEDDGEFDDDDGVDDDSEDDRKS